MEWLLFTYWLPPEPSRKRVFVWRQLKKIGAVSTEGSSWLLPKTDALSEGITDIVNTVEEFGGTASLYIANHFSEEQEQRTIDTFMKEREKEYSGIITECHKALKHIEREHQMNQFSFDEVEELEGDLEKIKRWYSEVRKRDFWESTATSETEKQIKEVEEHLAAFTHKTYEETTKHLDENI
jgi:hypothetical protein